MILASPAKKPAFGEEDEDDEAEEAAPAGDGLAGEAFDALKDGDRAGFIAAFNAAVGSRKAAAEPDADDDEE